MGERLSKTISGDDRISQILIASPNKGPSGLVVTSELIDDAGQAHGLDQIQVPARVDEPACAAFLEAFGLTLEEFQAKLKAGAYAARKVVRDREKAARLAQVAADQAKLAAQAAALAEA